MLYRLVEHYDTTNYKKCELIENKDNPEIIEECFVCLQETNNQEIPIKLTHQNLYIKTCECQGYIHKDCLSKWYNINMTCPICRQNMIILSNKTIQQLIINNNIGIFVYVNIYEPFFKIIYSRICARIIVATFTGLFYSTFFFIFYSILLSYLH